MPDPGMPPPMDMPPPDMAPPGAEAPYEPAYGEPMGGGGGGGGEAVSSDRIMELIEAMIDEKWSDFTENVNKIIDWKEKTDAKIVELEQKMSEMQGNFDKLHSAILEKVNQYDQNMHNVGIEIKALEKVFQKILPTLTENVNELSRITRDLKTSR